MNASPPPKLFGPTNELAKERNRAAAQRTLNAWIGNCLSFIGAGVAIEQIYQSLQQRVLIRNPQLTAMIAELTSMMLIAIGLTLLAIALVQHRLLIKAIEREDYVGLPIDALNRIVVAGILLIGCSGFLTILILQ